MKTHNKELVKTKFPCKVCGLSFDTRLSFIIHRRVHDRTRFKCPECEKSFKTKGEVKGHSVVHRKVRNFESPECGKWFKSKCYLRSHLKRRKHKESETEDFQCGICEEEFKSLIEMMKHSCNFGHCFVPTIRHI
jgi:KRAB domain-containing zinc finger protein